MEKHNQAILDMIARYKVHLREHGLADELYKWELIGKFQGRPDPDAVDLLGEISAVRFGNLLYQMAGAVMKHLAQDRTEPYRACLKALFDESQPLALRVMKFIDDTLRIYREIVPEERFGNHHDERTASVLLAYHAPDRYPIYKDSFYRKLCKTLGIKHKKVGEKYAHYVLLMQELIDDYIRPDAELQAIVQGLLPPTAYSDPGLFLLTQNMLYVVLDQERQEDQEENAEFELQTENPMKDKKLPLNQILYGPPGTGKTYHTINRALEILGEKTQDRAEMKRIFEEKLNAGQIAFVTFHQSMSYEDFVEGIKPKEDEESDSSIRYEIQLGIFRIQCVEAAFEFVQNTESIETIEVLSFAQAYDALIQRIGADLETGKKTEMMAKSGAKIIADGISDRGNITVSHQGGTRTYIVSKDRLAKLHQAFPDLSKVNNIYHEFRSVIGGANETAYYAVLSELRTIPKNLSQPEKRIYSFDEKREIVRTLKSKNFEKTDSALPHILIIDEINRGNVSQIFGELITLIEEDKRAGAKEALSVTLPYSKDTFSVPPNLYIIGTMNTADRSVEALDTALRRRFEFIEMAPNLLKVPEYLPDASDISPRDILRAINLRIEKLLDRDHQIGHAYFMGLENIAALQHAFEHKLLPLLQEYFYGDYAKIGLVLGKGFVFQASGHTQKAAEIFANFQTDAASDLAQRDVWHLRKIGDMSPDDFKAALIDLKPMPEATA